MKNIEHWIGCILSGAIIFLGYPAQAEEASKKPEMGTYSAFTEADWTVAFELKPEGKATIITELAYDYDAKGKRSENIKTAEGSWEFKAPYLTLSYPGTKDRFIQASNCYEKMPCFKYDRSIEKSSAKSPLNVNYEFVRWDSKPSR